MVLVLAMHLLDLRLRNRVPLSHLSLITAPTVIFQMKRMVAILVREDSAPEPSVPIVVEASWSEETILPNPTIPRRPSLPTTITCKKHELEPKVSYP
ncbi:hypothetical protein M413DRAFT_259495 [Hebeloma cylindrosporum]|uniref:Uncharacterized protein n=1 Tax=Hebeloma cylindrosporum TaxID=76867 RepID=A0A0C2Z0A3_HEBCY|nr:hypothetical protein M413DRAFT_259495 [Hebeloma cylindrosporum h7]